jgi:hypothetical protein
MIILKRIGKGEYETVGWIHLTQVKGQSRVEGLLIPYEGPRFISWYLITIVLLDYKATLNDHILIVILQTLNVRNILLNLVKDIWNKEYTQNFT